MSRKGIVAALVLLPIVAYAFVQDVDREEIRKQIEPVGKVNVVGGGVAPAAAAPVVAVKLGPGEATYKNHCIVCHAAGVAGAPKVHSASDWSPRLKKGLDGLLASATHGLNAMPPKGTCTECTDADLKAAIQFMSK